MGNGKSQVLNIIKRIAGTLYIPVAIYLVIFAIARASGASYFGDFNTWRNIVLNTGATATTAYALATQIKNGRYDFSGGSIMTLGALVAIYFTSKIAENAFVYLAISIVVCVLLSMFVATLYVYGRIPIIICTVGSAILFESITLVFNGGRAPSISNNATMNYLGKSLVPLICLTMVSLVIYLIFNNFRVGGKQAQLLSSNQGAAVNIGVNEKKNVYMTFLLSGFLYGIASLVFASQAFQVDTVATVLGTVSTAFSSMMPVFMGFYIGSFSTDAIGIFFSSAAVGILNYGITVVAPTGYAGACKNVVMGIFMIVFFFVSKKGPLFIKLCSQRFGKHSEDEE